jgi:hypothetical protein
MYKIDFFPGSHGHFLELVINTFVAQRPFDFNRPLFDENGACHFHLSYGDPRYNPVIFCKHYSFWNVEVTNIFEMIVFWIYFNNPFLSALFCVGAFYEYFIG